MADVVKVNAIANNETAFIAWTIDGMIDGCLGFEIVRLYRDTGEERCLASWVPFEGQTNKDWIPQDTGVWPVQKTSWRDLTLRRRRDAVALRPLGQRIAYRVRPVGDLKPGLEPVPVHPQKTYEGDARPLGYLGTGAESGDLVLRDDFDGAKLAFTNGVLSTQWLSHALETAGIPLGGPDSNARIVAELKRPDSPIRAYLHGEVPDVLTALLKRAENDGGLVHLALYELGDDVLCDAIIAAGGRAEIILSNSGRGDDGTWDAGNKPFRDRLKAAQIKVTDRLFNNNHIGHNKFAVYLEAGNGVEPEPKAVVTGSTNWTTTGICGQSNNSILFDDADMAKAFESYWQALKADDFPPPASEGAAGHVAQKQGVALRTADHTPETGNGWTAWFSPNDPTRSRKDLSVCPVDLADVFARIRAAEKAVFFLVFNPSRKGENSIITEALAAAQAKPDLLVMGAISDPRAMPNYVPPTHDPVTHKSNHDGKTPYVYPERPWEAPNISVVRAANLTKATAPAGFEYEKLTVGHAIVHDKIVIIDPMSDNPTVVTGSHNLGYKASYENDENLVIIEGAREIALAYATHFLDVFDHYKFRAWRRTLGGHGSAGIDPDDRWLRRYAAGTKGAVARYFAG